jgi:hypothetical protein
MWQFLLGLIVGFALGWWLDWYLSREAARKMREEMAEKNATIAKLQKDLLSSPRSEAKPVVAPPSVEPEPVETITAYCVKCRDTRPIQNPRRATLSNGRPAIKGTCPVCSSGMFRLIKL